MRPPPCVSMTSPFPGSALIWGMASSATPVTAQPRLLVVGAGAIANSLLPRVARMGWSLITIMDGDRVEEKNLERQELFAPVDIGKPKCEVLAAWLRNMPMPVHVSFVDEFLDGSNAGRILALHDVVADCTDDAHAKRLLDRKCAEYGLALVSGSVHGAQAQVIALHAEGPGEEIARDDLFSGKLGGEQDGCDMRHVPLATINETGRRMAQLLQALASREPVTNGRIDLFDGHQWTAIDPPTT